MMIMTIFDQIFFLLQICYFGAKIPKKCKNKNFPLILNIFLGVFKIFLIADTLTNVGVRDRLNLNYRRARPSDPTVAPEVAGPGPAGRGKVWWAVSPLSRAAI